MPSRDLMTRAVLLPTVFGLVQVADQLLLHLRSLDIRVKELEARG
jgi:hypothetical protein